MYSVNLVFAPPPPPGYLNDTSLIKAATDSYDPFTIFCSDTGIHNFTVLRMEYTCIFVYEKSPFSWITCIDRKQHHQKFCQKRHSSVFGKKTWKAFSTDDKEVHCIDATGSKPF